MTVGECTTISFDSPPTSKGHRNHSPLDPREHDTSNKLVFGATDNGALLGYDVSSSSSSPIIQIGATNGDALTACTFSNTDNLIACGSECGVISIYDLRSTISPLISMQRRKNVQVNSLSLNQRIASQRFNYQHSSSSSSGLILTVAGNDGSVALIDVMQDTTTAAAGGGGDGGHGTCSHPQLMAELIGADLEPIRGLAVSRNTIVTGERGGVVRMYSL